MVPQENGKRSLPGTLVELKGEGVLNLDLVKCLKGNPFHCSVKSPLLPLPCGILSGIKWRLSLQTSGPPTPTPVSSPCPNQKDSPIPSAFLPHLTRDLCPLHVTSSTHGVYTENLYFCLSTKSDQKPSLLLIELTGTFPFAHS